MIDTYCPSVLCQTSPETSLHDKREATEGCKLEMLPFTASNCQNAFSEALLHDLRNGTIQRNMRYL